MDKKELLILNPLDKLVFKGPFNHSTLKTMMITNPSENIWVAFKLKTTSPRLFFVRPNNGLIEPKQTVKIEIFMQPIQEAVLREHRRHKFLVQAAEAPDPAERTDMQEFWRKIGTGAWDAKVKCEFLHNDETENIGNEETRELEKMVRQAGGLDNKTVLHNNANYDIQDMTDVVQDEMEKLSKQVRVLEEERFYLKHELKLARKQKAEAGTETEGTTVLRTDSQMKNNKRGFYVLTVILIMAAAVIGALVGKYYV